MEFREITLADKGRIDAIRAEAGHVTSSHAFVSLYLWRRAMGLSVSFLGDAFLVKAREGYFFPCGREADVLQLLSLVWEEEPNAVFLYAREEDVSLCKRIYGEAVLAEADSASHEYLYARDEQIAMPGKKFTYQRAKVNKAKRLGETVSAELTEKSVDTCKAITREWAARREDKGDLDETLEALDNLTALGLYGNLLSIDGQPVGFNLGSYLSEDTFDIHIAKTLRDDVDTLMKVKLYKALPERVSTVNREEDLGIRGLAMHKKDAQPCGYNTMYKIFPVGKE